MLVLEILILAYLLFCIVAIVMARAAISTKNGRLLFIVIGLIMPFTFLYALFTSIFFRNSKVVPYNEELGHIEDTIEAERVRLFGGEVTCPSFNNRWEKTYKSALEKVAERTAKASRTIVEDLGFHLGPA